MDEEKKPFGNKKFLTGLITGIVAMLIIFGIGYVVMGAKNMSPAKAKTAVADFINKDLPEGQEAAKIDSISNFNCGLYKMDISLGAQKAEAYVSKDGKKIFPAAIDMVAPAGTSTDANNDNQATKPLTKNNKPKVDLFVMSYCPYGTQIEKGIIPVVEALGNKIDFNLRFVNYAMHNKQEIDENLKQYCIQKTQNDKLLPYLKCFLKAGDTAGCLKSTGVNEGKVNSCVTSADKEFKITANFNDKSTWIGSYPPFNVDLADNTKYGVQGSPTLVINGTVVESGRDSNGLLKTICGAFNDSPEACEKALSTATPAPGFGEGTTNNTAAADCAT